MTDFSGLVSITQGPEGSYDTGHGRLVRVAEDVALAGFSVDYYPQTATQLVAISHTGPQIGDVLTITRPETPSLSLIDVVPWTAGSALVIAESSDYETYSLYVGKVDVNTTTLDLNFNWLFAHPVGTAEEDAFASSWPEEDRLFIVHNNGTVSEDDKSFSLVFEVSTGTVIEEAETPSGDESFPWPAWVHGCAINTESEEFALLGEYWFSGSGHTTVWTRPISGGTPGTWSDPGWLGPEFGSNYPRYAALAPIHDDGGWHVGVSKSNTGGVVHTYKLDSDLVWAGGTSISNAYFGLSPFLIDVERDAFAGKTIVTCQDRIDEQIVYAVMEEGVGLTPEFVPGFVSVYWDVTSIACVGADKYIYLIGGYDTLIPPNPSLPLYGWATLAVGAQGEGPGEEPEEEPNRQIDDKNRRAFRPMRSKS